MNIFSARVSIIIPLLNEAALTVPALQRLGAISGQAEVVVVDGGSTDGSRELAAPFCRVLQSEPNRARQCNMGVRNSSGDWLLFLHLDTTLPSSFLRDMATLAQRNCQAGAFRLQIEGNSLWLRLLSWGANWRTKYRNIALGDQACFVKRDLFERLGGFPELPMMEDYAFSLKVKQARIRWRLAPSVVCTSGIRWQQQGFWRTWWLFRCLFYQFHHHPDFLIMLKKYPPSR